MARWEPPLRLPSATRPCSTSTIRPALRTAPDSDVDLTKSFTLDDSAEEIQDFLHRVGFVHLRGVLDGAEIAALSADVTEALGRARPDDRKSWWTTVNGREVCDRVNYLNDGSKRIAALGADPRFVRIGASAVTTSAMPTIASTGTASSSRSRDRREAWPTCPGITIAAWVATR